MNVLGHLKTITKHHNLVMGYCFRAGLYQQGLLHDLSKLSPEEFLVGAKYYQGTRSPNNAEREATGVSRAWLHHKGRNKHHYEYWIDYDMNAPEGRGLGGMQMPRKYVAEMIFDRGQKPARIFPRGQGAVLVYSSGHAAADGIPAHHVG